MKDLKLYLIIACSLLAVYLLVEYNKPQPINWTPTYDKADKIPFGTYVLYHELPQLFQKGIKPSRQSIYETLTHAGRASVLIISPNVNISATDFDQMKTFLNQGHDVFIAAKGYNYAFLDSLKLAIQLNAVLIAKDSLRFHFVNPSLHPEKEYRFKRGLGATYFSKFDTLRTTVLAKNNKDQALFIRYTFGKGHLYLTASPDFFSNYALLSPDGAEFAAQALAYLPTKKTLIFDQYQALGAYGDRSFFRVIFSNPPLKWAYYLLLASLVLFVIYNSKRRQRIIPVEDPMKNTSVDFAKVVGGVYYQQRDNKDIVHKKVIYLLHFIRNHYRLKTSELDAEFRESLINRSGVEEEIIDKLLKEINAINRGKYLSDQELMALNENIEQFYEQSGIVWNKNFSSSAPI
ncbi:hypothetical protein GCM10023231_38040 [Olivibacter ginsenosidimutans]|uniref:DUF4350 domain-containing protein n=1 Tax=Olivibacter ginsenosidimutans TaxID=1176537 RepID=A0ABP9C8V6_9SPHI